MITINLLPEKWKAIPDFPSYAASNQGRIMSNLSTYPGRILKPATDKGGYLYLTVYEDKKPKTCKVARLIALSFLGPCPVKKETNHKNGIKTDNNIQNLEYVTKKENAQHASSLGLLKSRKGELNPNAKLKQQDVIAIVKLRELGWTLQNIANQFNVYATTIGFICSGGTWNSVTKIK